MATPPEEETCEVLCVHQAAVDEVRAHTPRALQAVWRCHPDQDSVESQPARALCLRFGRSDRHEPKRRLPSASYLEAGQAGKKPPGRQIHFLLSGRWPRGDHAGAEHGAYFRIGLKQLRQFKDELPQYFYSVVSISTVTCLFRLERFWR